MTSTIPSFRSLTSRMVPLPIDHVDTDQIIPAEFLKVTERGNLGAALFRAWRQDPHFVLHRQQHQGGKILLAGENFGCGSSREHAPWALLDYGFKAVVSSRFADIFRGNALKNGLLPVALDGEVCQQLFAIVEQDPGAKLTIDLENSWVTLPDGLSLEFEVDAFARACLLEGRDQLGCLLAQEAQIAAYESSLETAFDTRHGRFES